MPPNNQQDQRATSPASPGSVTPPPASPIQVPHKPEPSVATATPPKAETVGVTTTAPQVPVLSTEEEIALIEKKMTEKAGERATIEEESKKLFSERHALEDAMTPIAEEEKAVLAQIVVYEKKRSLALDPHDARLAETARWEAEEHRRGIEHKKWAVAGELEAIDVKIKDVERRFKELSREMDTCASDIEKLRIKKAHKVLEEELAKASAERVATEEELKRFSEERARLEKLFQESVAREEEAITQEHAVEEKHEIVRSVYEEQVLAEERHKLEDARREAEQKRWEAEDAIPAVLHREAGSSQHLEEIKKKEAEILAKLDTLGK